MITKKRKLKLPSGVQEYKGKFRVSVCVNYKRKTKVVDTLAEALQVREEMQKALSIPLEKQWTLTQAVDKTLLMVWQGKASEEHNHKNIKAILEFFGKDCYLADITLERIDAFVETLLIKGNSGATVNRKLSCLSRILRTAYERGVIEKLPKMPKRSEAEHRVRFLSADEEERLLYACEVIADKDLHDVISVLLYTGLRCGELWRLEARDVDLDVKNLTVWKTKTNRPRTIPIVDKILHTITERTEKGGLLFPYSNQWLRPKWARVRHLMDMDNDVQFTPHMLRHSCATRLSQKGVSLPIIKEWLGHSTIITTTRYAHFSSKDLRHAADMLDSNMD